MTEFDPRITSVGIDRSTNCATTTCLNVFISYLGFSFHLMVLIVVLTPFRKILNLHWGII